MSASDLPRDWSDTPAAKRGFRSFWAGHALDTLHTSGARRGWWLGYARAFAEGALRYAADMDGPRESPTPYEQFSPAWEAWADGYDQSADLA